MLGIALNTATARGLGRRITLLLLLAFGLLLLAPGVLAQGPPAFVPGRLLVGFRPEVSQRQAEAVLAERGARTTGVIPRIGVHIVQLPPAASETALARAFGQRPEVLFAEVDHILAPAATPDDPYYGSQWHLAKIAGPTAWDTTGGSSTVIIAILDTGVDGTHPDLAAKMVPGWNTYDNNSNTADVHGHGTATAGTATAIANNGSGVASVAWDCRLMPVRISDTQGYGYDSTVASGLTWAADHGARVANNSYEFSDSSTVASAAKYFQSRGGVVTISAGNGSTYVNLADNPYVLTVGATGSTDALASWSNTGPIVDLVAPGVGIYTTNRGGGYGSWSGTSFSAPVAAGVAALVISANPYLSAAQVQNILMQSADDLGTAGKDTTYGWGRVNAARAVQMALETVGSGGVDTTAPSASFTSPAAGATVSGSVTVQVSATDDTGVASVSLSVDGAALGPDTSYPYSFPWNTLGVANGTHTLTATARDDAGNASTVQIAVTVQNEVDSTAPTVAITSPADGSTIGTSTTVSAQASDNVGVVKVEFYVDGKLKATDTSAPYSLKWNSRKTSKGAHTLQCKAYDDAGNVGVSPTVTVYR